MAGLFLVTHGSRDRTSWQFLQDLVNLTCCLNPGIPIGGGCLEGQPQPLEEQLQTFCQPLPPSLPVAIAPIFLLSGVHTHSDIPRALAIAQTLCPQPLELLPPLGHWQGTKDLLHTALASPPPAPTILLTHGSSRPEAQEEFCQLCIDLHCLPASWRMAPWLGDRLRQHPGAHVVPYLIRSLPADIQPFIESLGGTLLPNPLPPRAIATLTIQQFSQSMNPCNPVH